MKEKNEEYCFLVFANETIFSFIYSQHMMPNWSTGGDRNLTSVTMFVLLGISEDKELQLSLFPVFLLIYLVTLFWNLGLIILIRMDSHLHTPMYLFLGVLSFIDVCYSSSISPRRISDFFKDKKAISFIACASQCFVASWMGQAESCLLAAMASDRYVAIGKPLQYSSIMEPGLCWKMIAGALGCGLLCSLVEVVTGFELYYCGPSVIQNFFCSLVIILLSYGFIAASILKISSVKGSAKAFNTCASHLVVVTLLYGTALTEYMHPSSGHSKKQNKFLSVFYVIIPMLNPFIYSLRNKDIKEALRRVIKSVTLTPQ
ncbi:olfactory receptor 1440-like [Talpa occidentalis]|uniref:olfactory receptor 1440-like n=1 Tax=Talpa occidentalis TaxID=50954 RepID=UPI00188DEE84|nr:olfactory receptor 1440-like [Talpa occidentalis]